jgi:16S rRNA (guanine527-N7)-methyltransferase
MREHYQFLYIPRMDETVQLEEGARALGIALAPGAARQLLRLLDELALWNANVNLTGIVQREKMITHHLLDSLTIHSDIRGNTVADVGTGAGFPGLPLALVDPARQYTLIDSNNKKIRFVTHAVTLLELSNVTPLHARAESLRPKPAFDTVVARALAPLPDLLRQVAPLAGPSTRILAMKGKRPDAELAAVPPGWRVLETRPLQVPGLPDARTLITLEKT